MELSRVTEQEKKSLWNKIQSIENDEKRYMLTIDYLRVYGKVVSVTELE